MRGGAEALGRQGALALCALALVTALLLPGSAQAGDGESGELRQAVAFARDKVYPTLVNITVVERRFVQGREERGVGAGSGVTNVS